MTWTCTFFELMANPSSWFAVFEFLCCLATLGLATHVWSQRGHSASYTTWTSRIYTCINIYYLYYYLSFIILNIFFAISSVTNLLKFLIQISVSDEGNGWMDGWMDERCFRPLLCTVKAELGRGQPGLMRWIWDETLSQSSIDRSTFYSAAHRATKWASGRPRNGWMDERCLRPLFCTIKAELGRLWWREGHGHNYRTYECMHSGWKSVKKIIKKNNNRSCWRQ